MIIDKENLFSYQQAVTVTAVSDDVIDLGPNHWAGASGSDKEIPLFMHIDEGFTAAGAATLTVEIQSSNTENFSGTVKTHHSRVWPVADLVNTGRMPLDMSLPPDVLRYVRANYTVATGPMTAGAITCGVTASRQTNF